MRALALTLGFAALGGCKASEFASVAVGRYEGVVLQKSPGQSNQVYARGELTASSPRELTLNLKATHGPDNWDFVLRIQDKSHAQLSSPSGWISEVELVKSSDECFAPLAKSDTRLCFDGHEFTMSLELKTPGQKLFFLLNRLDPSRLPTLEKPAVYTLSQIITRAKSQSFQTRVEFERVVQARLESQVAWFNLLPHLNYNTISAALGLDVSGAVRAGLDLAPFVLPARWYHAVGAKFAGQAEFYGWAVMGEDAANIAESLAYAYSRDMRAIQRLADQADLTQQIRDQIRDRERSGLIQVGSSDDITSVLDDILRSESVLEQAVKEEQAALSQAVGFFNPLAVSDVVGSVVESIDAITDDNLKGMGQLALERSLELKQLDALVESAKANVGERSFAWIDPVGDPNAALGLSYPAYIGVGKAHTEEIRAKRRQTQSLILNKVTTAGAQANQAAYNYTLSESEAEVQTHRVERLTQNIRMGIRFELSDLVNALTEQAKVDIEQVNAEYAYYTALCHLRRLTYTGMYADLPNQVGLHIPEGALE